MGLHDARRGRGVDWLGSRDFETVATLAGLDPDCARSLADRMRAEIRAAEAAAHGPRQRELPL